MLGKPRILSLFPNSFNKFNKDTGEILNNLKSKGSVIHVTITGFIKQTFDRKGSPCSSCDEKQKFRF